MKEISKTIGFDVAKLEKDATSYTIKAKMVADRKYTEKMQMCGVPMFLVKREIQRGAFADEVLKAYIKQANEMQ